MRILQIFLVALVASVGSTVASVRAETVEQPIQTVFAELRTLKPMLVEEEYTLLVAGEKETGRKERFLRRRTAQEISNSGLSSGCGDYAILFIDRIEPQGFHALLVDAAEISSASLLHHFSDHAVVAIRSKEDSANAPWWLVDSTSRRILSRQWQPTEKSFQAFGRTFWIGYCGPLSGYPVHSGQTLRAFYTRTLADVPSNVLNHAFCRFKFIVDPSLIDDDGKYLNHRLANFLQEQTNIFAIYGIHPEREVSITLKRGGNDGESDLTYSEADGWVSHIGLKSGCSPSLLSHFERTVRKRDEHKFD